MKTVKSAKTVKTVKTIKSVKTEKSVKTVKTVKTEKSLKTVKTIGERKTILFWNSYWDWRYFQMGVGNRGFKSCPEFKNCYTTTTKTKLTNPHEIIDAIVFHGVRLNISEIQYLKKKRHLLSKVNKGIEPLYILFMLVSLIKSCEAIRFKNYSMNSYSSRNSCREFFWNSSRIPLHTGPKARRNQVEEL